MLLTLSLSLLIGLLLGLLGGGGSILIVPMLVYLLHVEPKKAILISFVVVGVSSVIAMIPHALRGKVCWRSGVFFGMAGMAGAYAGGHMAAHFSADFLMTLFGLVVLSTGFLMLTGGKPEQLEPISMLPDKVCPVYVPYLRVLFDGFFVGMLTGMVGVGGGFLIVPALTLFVGFPIKGAVGTSLLVIAMNALAGLTGYIQHVSLDFYLTGLVASGTIVGSGLGAWLSVYVKPGLLRRGFGLMVLLVAGYTLSQSVTARFLKTVDLWLIEPQSPELLIGVLLCFWLLLRIGRWIHKTDVVFLSKIDVSADS